MVEEPGSTTVYVPWYLHKVGGSSVQMLWLTCNIITEHSQVYHPETFASEHREQTGILTHTWFPCQVSTRCHKPVPSSNQLLKTTWHIKIYTEVTSLQDRFTYNTTNKKDYLEKPAKHRSSLETERIPWGQRYQ